MIMQMTCEMLDGQCYFLQNYIFWDSKEKTLMTINLCVVACFGIIPVLFIPIRYFIVAGLWGLVSLSSPFCKAIGQAILQLAIEYEIGRRLSEIYERFENGQFHFYSIVGTFLSWIPFLKRLAEIVKQKQEGAELRRPTSMQQFYERENSIEDLNSNGSLEGVGETEIF